MSFSTPLVVFANGITNFRALVRMAQLLVVLHLMCKNLTEIPSQVLTLNFIDPEHLTNIQILSIPNSRLPSMKTNFLSSSAKDALSPPSSKHNALQKCCPSVK